MPLDNGWIRYIDRTYQQIKDRVLTDLGLLVPEMTDHTESNPYVKALGVWSGIAEQLGYYIDNAAREAHLPTCRLYKSGIKHAMTFDYRVHASLPATGLVTFMLNKVATAPITIPVSTELQNEDGMKFQTLQEVIINVGQTEATVNVAQFEFVSGYAAGSTSGLANQKILLPSDLMDESAQVSIASVVWEPSFTLGYSVREDLVYVQTVNESKIPYLQFGDDVTGKIATGGNAILVDYKRTLGYAGNVEANTITNITGTITLPGGYSITAINYDKLTGGQGVETLDQLKSRVPKSIRTLRRAVTRKDFIQVTEMNPGVAKAGVEFDCGKYVNIYILPVGGGVASPTLITSTDVWLDDKKVITTRINVDAAGQVNVLLGLDLRVKPGFSRAVTAAKVKNNLVAFMEPGKQDINGTVHISDLYEIIEGTTGVDNSEINVLRSIPYARRLAPTLHTLIWDRVLKPGSVSSLRWSITMTSSTNFDLVKDGSFVGNFAISAAVNTFPELDFTVNAGTYSVGDNWEFWTYPYYGTLVLLEPSAPAMDAGDITINATGGI